MGLEDSQKIDYKKLIIPSSNPSLAQTASSGYIPNFAKQLTGTGAGMLYQDPDFTEIGGGQSGKFLAPKSGQGFGQKIFYKAGSEKISQEYNVNKALSDFESQNPSLFKENAISFTKVGQLLNRGELLAGFERELINESGVDEFATSRFKQKPEEEAQFAFFLSERMAQLGVKNVLKAYTDKYGQDSLKVYDIYAQNFKINKIMQDYVAQKTMEVYDSKKDAYNQIDGLPVGSYNAQAGGKGGFHTMFDTMGAVGSMKTASGGYVPNFAKLDQAKVLRFGPQVRDLTMQQYEAQQSGGAGYVTGLRGTSFDEENAKNDIAASILGPNYFLPDENFVSSLMAKFAYNKIGETSTMFGMMPQMKRDATSFVEGKVSGRVRELKYQKLGKIFDTIAKNRGMESVWNQILEKKSQTGRENPTKLSEDIRGLVSQFRPVVIDELTKRLREEIVGFITQIPRHDAEFLAFGEKMELGPDGKLSEKDEAKVREIQEKQKYFMSLGLPKDLQRGTKSVLDRIALKDPTKPKEVGIDAYARTKALSGILQRITDQPEYFWGSWKNEVQETLNRALPPGPQSDFVKKYINNNYEYDQVKKKKFANSNIARFKKVLYTLKEYGIGDWDNIDFPASLARSAHSGYIPNFSQINPNDLNFVRRLTGKDSFGIYRKILASTKKANKPVGSLEFKELLYPDSKGNLSFNVDFIEVIEKFRGKGMSSLLYEEMFKQTKEIGEEKKRAGEKIAGVKIMGEAVEQAGSRPFPQIYTREKAGEKFGAKTDILDPISGKPLPKNLQQEILKGNKNSGASSFPVDSIMQFAHSGYIPNFSNFDGDDRVTEGDGIIKRLRNLAKKTLTDPIALGLANQAIQSILGLPEGIDAIEIGKNIFEAINAPRPAAELEKIKQRRSPKGLQKRIRDYLEQQNRSTSAAHSGFVPNFADGPLMDAIQREKLESGLPLSAISVVRDGRLKNSQNPNGLAVINKRDEPNGKIPNFVKKNESFDAAKLKAFEESILRLTKFTGDLEKAMENFATNFGTSVDTVKRGVDNFLNNLPISQGIAGNETANKDPNNPPPSGGKTPSSEKPPEDLKEKKTAQDSIYALLKWQTVLSFASGALSKFGDNAAKVGEALSGFGTAIISAKEGASGIKNAFGIQEGETIKGKFSSGIEAAKKARNQEGGAKDFGVGAFIKGGGGAAIGAAVATGGIYAVAAYEGLKGVDAIFQILAGTSKKSKKALDALTESQEKYTVSLNTSGKSLQEKVAQKFDYTGAAIGGYFNEIGVTGIFRGKTTKEIKQLAGETGFNEETISKIAADLSSFVIPKVQAENPNKPAYLLENEVTRQTLQLFKELRNQSLVQGIKEYPYEVGEIFNQQKFLENLPKFRQEKSKQALEPAGMVQMREETRLAPTELLKKELDLQFKLKELEIQKTTALERRASFHKDILSNTEKERRGYEVSLKQEEERKKLQLEILNIYQTQARSRLDKFLSVSGGVITPERREQINEKFNELINAEPEKRGEALENYLKSVSAIKAETETAKDAVASFLKTEKEFIDLAEKGAKESYKNRIVEALDLLKLNNTKQKRNELDQVSFNLLKQQIDSSEKLIQMQIMLPNSKQRQLSIEKELLSTSDARKMQIDSELKALEEQKRLRVELNGIIKSQGSQRLEEYFKVAGFNSLDQNFIRKSFDKIFEEPDADLRKKNINDFFSKILTPTKKYLDESTAGQTLGIFKELQNILNDSIDTAEESSRIRSRENEILQSTLALTKQRNILEEARKEIIASNIIKEQKALDIEREKMSLSKDIAASQYELSNLNKRKGGAQSLRDKRFSIGLERDYSLRELENRDKASSLQNRQNFFNEISKIAPGNFKLLTQASKENDPEKQKQILAKALKEQYQSYDIFTKKMYEGGDIIVESARKFAAILKGDNEAAKSLKSDRVTFKQISKESNITKLNNEIKSLEDEIEVEKKNGKTAFLLEFKRDEIKKRIDSINKEIINKEIETLASVRVDAFKTPRAPEEAKTKILTQAELAQRTAEREYYLNYTAAGGFEKATNELDDSLERFNNELAYSIPMGFRDGMMQAMRDVTNGTKSLKDSLLDAALSFLKKLNESMQKNLADRITRSLFGSSERDEGGGGSILGRLFGNLGGLFKGSMGGGGGSYGGGGRSWADRWDEGWDEEGQFEPGSRHLSEAASFPQQRWDPLSEFDTFEPPAFESTNDWFPEGYAYASGGPIKGGSGYKDDVPALLMGGE